MDSSETLFQVPTHEGQVSGELHVAWSGGVNLDVFRPEWIERLFVLEDVWMWQDRRRKSVPSN